MSACHTITLDQLLSLRDGEPVAADVVSHAEQCAVCAHELARLHQLQSAMRTMPQLSPPTYDGAALRARAKRTPHNYRWMRIGVAAAVGAIAILLVLANLRNGSNGAQMTLTPTPTLTDEHSAEPPLTSLVIRSQELESRLRQLPRRPYLQRAGTATAIYALQNQIQWVDYQLSVANDVGMTERQSMELWQDRVQLMDTLVKVRYVEAQRIRVLP